MSGYKFLGEHGTFEMENPQHTSGLYIPVAGNTGLRSAISPDFGGDSKLDQNHFLIAPKSISNLHSDRDTRNFFVVTEDDIWSACGASASQEADRFTDREDKVTLTGGRMWQSVKRTNKKNNLTATVTIFSLLEASSEIMTVTLRNDSDKKISFTPVAAVPIYARSADNLRDHRHVTSLLNRAVAFDMGVVVKPTLSFDERGHQKNGTAYFVMGADEKGNAPKALIADADLYLGEGGTYTRPVSLLKLKEDKAFKKAPFETRGKEMIGALKFEEVTLTPGTEVTYQIACGAVVLGKDISFDTAHIKDFKTKDLKKALDVIKTKDGTEAEFERTKDYWNNLTNIHVKTGDKNFDSFMEWIAFQPQLRRIYGCSFLPHHDYGRGGRGWRDLWQDCLALLLTDPSGVRDMILSNFQGVRLDGTNATIIGDKPGEFKADRNGIPRVWMDHGFWPFLTLKLYMDQTGDLDILSEEVTYFKDSLTCRAEKRDELYDADYGVVQKGADKEPYKGTVLEHLLIQNLTAFYDVGDNGNIRLRGADWNDALDMASHKGESVAFTCGYAGNLKDIAICIRTFIEKSGKKSLKVTPEICDLLFEDKSEILSSPARKKELLFSYMEKVSHCPAADKKDLDLEECAKALLTKSDILMEQIRKNEWVTDSEGNGFFNGYYDDLGRRVEGEFDTEEGKSIRMMLTGQVFSVMSGTATDDQVKDIIKSADRYLYSEGLGGYRLNTDFKQLRTDLGRMFGFSYGDKENGAVFSHMAVMFGNGLYKRGFAGEGFKAMDALYKASSNFEVSRIYPGVPEYFNAEGRGLYNYLTGAGSWFLMTIVTEDFGVKGVAGDLMLKPGLTAEQFDNDGNATISLPFRNRNFTITYRNLSKKNFSEYSITKVLLDGKEMGAISKDSAVITAAELDALNGSDHTLEIILS